MLCPPILSTVASGNIRKSEAVSAAARSCLSVSERSIRSVSSSAVVLAMEWSLLCFNARPQFPRDCEAFAEKHKLPEGTRAASAATLASSHKSPGCSRQYLYYQENTVI